MNKKILILANNTSPTSETGAKILAQIPKVDSAPHTLHTNQKRGLDGEQILTLPRGRQSRIRAAALKFLRFFRTRPRASFSEPVAQPTPTKGLTKKVQSPDPHEPNSVPAPGTVPEPLSCKPNPNTQLEALDTLIKALLPDWEVTLIDPKKIDNLRPFPPSADVEACQSLTSGEGGPTNTLASRNDASIEKKIEELVISEKPAFVIADRFYGTPLTASEAADKKALFFLHLIKRYSPKTKTCLISTLPDSQLEPFETPRIDHVIPLAATNANPWEELVDLVRIRESRYLVKSMEAADDYDAEEYLEELLSVLQSRNPYLSEQVRKKGIFFNGTPIFEAISGPASTHGTLQRGASPTTNQPNRNSASTHKLRQQISSHLETHGLVLEGFSERVDDQPGLLQAVVIKNIRVATIRINHVFIEKHLILVNLGAIERACFIHNSTICNNLNLVSIQFNSGLSVSTNTFGGTQQGADDFVHEKAARLPWIRDCVFGGETVFSNNHFHHQGTSQTEVPGITFCRSVFRSRLDISFGQNHKLSFYGCLIDTLCKVDIHFCFLSNRAASVTRHESGLRRQEIRWIFCDIQGVLTVRESPAPIGLNDRGTSSALSNLGAVRGLEPPPYRAFYGIGVSLTGTTLKGVVDLRQVRVAWFNMHLVNVLGGAMYVSSQAIYQSRREYCATRDSFLSLLHSKWSFSSSLRASTVDLLLVELQPDREPLRFSQNMNMEGRLCELGSPHLVRLARYRRIIQQYDDLRKAFSNATNSHLQEDYCHFKQMEGIGLVEWLQASYTGSFSKLLGFGVLWFTLTAILNFLICRSLSLTTEAYIESTVYLLAPVFGLYIFLSRSARMAIGALARVVFRHAGYLVYPYRILALSLACVYGFAGIYCVGEAVEATGNQIFVTRIVSTHDRPTDAGANESSLLEPNVSLLELDFSDANSAAQIEHVPDPEKVLQEHPRSSWPVSGFISNYFRSFPRMIYLSAVVFTTLGFGDELPVGLMRPIANLEAILGAVFLSLITASIFRQVIRR